MQTRRVALLVSIGVSILAFALFFLVSTERSHVQLMMSQVRASVESDDDPEARRNYELMMLRDPRTGQLPDRIREKELAFAAKLPKREALVRLGKGLSVQAATWNLRGPYNVGGRTRALAIDATNENLILAGGVSGGMWRSTDGGASWLRTTSLSTIVQSVTCLAQDTRIGRSNVWYYGTGEYLGNSARGGGLNAFYSGDGIYKSTDGGITWSILPSTATNTPQTFDNFFDYIWNIVIDPSNLSQDEVYAATYGLIQRSTNGGTSWTTVLGGSSALDSRHTDVAITPTGVLYATLGGGGSQDGIYRSIDGLGWTKISPAGWPTVYNRIVIGVAPSDPNVIYFLAETPASGVKNHSLWKYDAALATWGNRSANIPSFGGKVGDFDSQGSYDLVVKVKPDDPNVLLIGGTNLYRSTDGFATASKTTWIGGYSTANDVTEYQNHHADQHSLAFLPSNPDVLFSGHDGGISQTTNILASTLNWTTLNTGYLTAQFYTVALDQSTAGNNVIIGGMQDNGTWFSNATSSTANWKSVFSGDGAFCAVTGGRTSYYVSSQNGNVYRMVLDNNGNSTSWTRVTPANASGYLFINPFVLDPNEGRRMFLAAGRTIWRNADLTGIPLFSNNATSVNWDSLATSTVSSGTISALAMSTTPANRLYFGTSSGAVYRLDDSHTTNPVRTTITGGTFPANGYVSCIAVDPTNAENVLAVFSNYKVQSLFSTTTGGLSWTAVGGNLEQFPDGTGNGPSLRWVTILPIGSFSMYFVGTSVGLFSTTSLDGASTIWSQEGASTIGNVVVPMVVSRPVDGLVVAATHANGVYTANVASTPAAPTLASPADGATSIPTSSTLRWNSVTGATSYTLHVSTASDFSTFVVNQGGITSTSFPIAGLQNGTQYFWRVSATNVAGAGPFSSIRSFTTIVAAPAAPTLASPSDGATGVSTSPTLVWNALSDAASYTVQLSTTSAFAFLLVNQSGITATSFTVSGLSTNTQYFWRASATNAGGTSLFSATRSFTTSPPSSVELVDGVIPKEFGLAQNYPNPFNPTTIIEFSVAKETRVRIGVLDATGRKVVNLVDGVKSPGRYTVRWDGRDSRGNLVASGVYFYRFESPLYSTTRKMALVR